MKAFCGVTYPLGVMCWKMDTDRTSYTGHWCCCLPVRLHEVLGCWLCCELLRKSIALEAWGLGCFPPSLPVLQFLSCLCFQRLWETVAPGKKRYSMINSPSQRITAFGSFVVKWSRINLLYLIHASKYFTFSIWNRNTCCKNTQPQMKCLFMWMYPSP